MSLFDFPRIHLWGTQEVNAGTGNNNSASPGAELTVTSDTARVRANTRGMTDEQFRRWMMSLDQSGLLRAQWNYFGNFSFRFCDVRVGSVQFGPDRLVTDKRQEPLIGAQVYLHNAILIDTNPEGYHTSQVFCEALEVRGRGALAGTGVFLSRSSRMSLLILRRLIQEAEGQAQQLDKQGRLPGAYDRELFTLTLRGLEQLSSAGQLTPDEEEFRFA